jgi:hypothetical protein
MNRKSFFRLAWALTLLLAFSLGCKLVNEAQDLVALATDIDVEGLATDIDLDSLATDIDIEGLSTDIDIERMVTDIDIDELSTEMGSVVTDMAPVLTEMGSFLTDMPGLDGTLVAVATPSGFPDDIPVMDGQKLSMSGAPNRLEYSLDADFNAAVDYYRREMAARGWVEGGSNVQEGEASLVFQKGNRRATVHISEDFLFGLAIEITVEG